MYLYLVVMTRILTHHAPFTIIVLILEDGKLLFLAIIAM